MAESHDAAPSDESVKLSDYTTIGVGGPARRFLEAHTEEEILEALQAADAKTADGGELPLLVLGGGSNVLIADAGYKGIVLRLATTGYQVESADPCGGVWVRVQAGQPWDDFVAEMVAAGYSGLEALSGIPGSAGATPVQNVGAYGAEVSQTIASVRVWDREEQQIRTLSNSELEFAYRDSWLKRSTTMGSPRFVVLSVQFQLGYEGSLSMPIRYAELAKALGVDLEERAPIAHVREVVLQLRRGKGMVWDEADRDSHSTGSFFTNPLLSPAEAKTLPEEAPRYPALSQDGRELVKTSAAWLISQAGFNRGFGLELTDGRASLSTKHSLAISNRGGASAEDVLTLARAVRDGVQQKFGVRLEPESLLIGLQL